MGILETQSFGVVLQYIIFRKLILNQNKIDLLVGMLVLSVCFVIAYAVTGTLKFDPQKAYAPTIPPQTNPFYESITV